MVEGEEVSRYTQWRRGGRVVECGGLENRYVGNPGVGGSNPPLSAEARRCAACRTLRPSGYACQHTPACGLRLSARFALKGSLVSMLRLRLAFSRSSRSGTANLVTHLPSAPVLRVREG